MQEVIQLIVGGILQGGILALLSVGLALIFGVARVVNFAQADFMMLGMYAVLLLSRVIALNSYLLALLAFFPFCLLGWAIYTFIIKRVAAANESLAGVENAQLMVTLALSLLLQNGAQMIFGADPRSLKVVQKLDVWRIAGVIIDKPRTVAFILALVLGFGLFLLLRTAVGRNVRAAADDPEAAAYVGVNVHATIATAFAVAIGLAAVAGGVLLSYYPVQPQTGQNFLLLVFTAMVLGGMGNVSGALIGGLILGLVQSLAGLVVPLQLSNVIVFGIFIIVLLLRPNGIFGKVQKL